MRMILMHKIVILLTFPEANTTQKKFTPIDCSACGRNSYASRLITPKQVWTQQCFSIFDKTFSLDPESEEVTTLYVANILVEIKSEMASIDKRSTRKLYL